MVDKTGVELVEQSSPKAVRGPMAWQQPAPGRPQSTLETDQIDANAASNGTARQNLLIALKEKKSVRAKELSPFEQNILKGFDSVQRSDGQQTLFAIGSNTPVMTIESDRHVCVNCNAPVGSAEQIDAMLRSAVVAKAVKGDEGSDPCAPDEKTRLIMIKCAELAGLKINHPPTQSLDHVDPKLAAQVEAQWAKMKDQHQPQSTEKYGNKPTVSETVRATTDLVTVPSNLDKTPSGALSQTFIAAAIGLPAVTSAPTAQPSVKMRPAL